MRKLSVLVIIALIGAIGYFGYAKVQQGGLKGRAEEEAKTQEAEKQECKKRLTAFYQAWEAYRKDHKGKEPPTIEDLFPKYLKDGNILICPTADRWLNQKKKLIQFGRMNIERRSYIMTYGFNWLTSGNSIAIKHMGDKAPLVTCTAHPECLYRAVYDKSPPAGAFSTETKAQWIEEVGNAKVLAVHRDGSIGEDDASEH